MGCGFMYEIYTINKDDEIDDILRKYNIDMEELVKINGIIDLNNLKEGMQIIVPVNRNNIYKYYTVKKGDTISGIASLYNIDKDMLVAINGLDMEDYIYPNQTLILPNDGVLLYLTKSGDTIRDVLDKFNVSIEELLRNNENIYLMEEQIISFIR